MKIAQGKRPPDGLDTEEVTEPTVFHQLHAPSVGCNLESDAVVTNISIVHATSYSPIR